MPVSVTTILSPAALTQAMHGPNSAPARAAFKRAKKVEAAAKRRAPVDTGRLRTSIHTEMRVIGGVYVSRVGTDVSYARSVHGGTGIYGPRHTPIRPVSAQVLIFRPRGSSRVVVARQVQGQRPKPFLRDALKDV